MYTSIKQMDSFSVFFTYFLISAKQVALFHLMLQPLLQLGNLSFLLLQLTVQTLTCICL